MNGTEDRLAAALADRYRIERELGQGERPSARKGQHSLATPATAGRSRACRR